MELEDLDFEKIMERLRDLAYDGAVYSNSYGHSILVPRNINFYNQMTIIPPKKTVKLSKRVVDILIEMKLLQEIDCESTTELGLVELEYLGHQSTWKKYKIHG